METKEDRLSLGKSGTSFVGLDILRVAGLGTPLLEWRAECSEFTCRCPITGQPDWASISVVLRNSYYFVETKTLKLYLETFREVGIFHEHLAQTILDTIVGGIETRKSKSDIDGHSPYSAEVRVKFNQRGGIGVEASALYSGFEEDPK